MTPFFSIIVPVRDGAATLGRCLASVRASDFADWELIVVDDGSADGSAALATGYGATLLQTVGGQGPAAARNLGATVARGRWLFFTDADCALHRDTLSRAAAILTASHPPDALIGSYDDRPADPHFVSQFKNLTHHYVHQTSGEMPALFGPAAAP